MHAGLFDVFHDAADQGGFAVGNAIDVDLNRIVEEAVQQDWRIMRHLDRFAHVALEVALLMDDFHGTAAEDIRWPHDQRIADFRCQAQGIFFGARSAVRRLAQAQLMQQFLETLAVFGSIDHVWRRADDRHAIGFEIERQLQRRLAAVLHDHAVRLFKVNDFQHVFQRERLEIQAVGRIVIGRDGLGITVDHDGFITVFTHGQRRMHAAVVEFNALADAVRTAAKDHDFFPVSRLRFAFFVVSRIHVRRIGGEFAGAGIDALVDRPHIEFAAQRTDRRVGGL